MNLGFEEESTMAEYEGIVANACDRSVKMVYYSVVLPLAGYFRGRYSVDKSVSLTADGYARVDIEEFFEKIGMPERGYSYSQVFPQTGTITFTTPFEGIGEYGIEQKDCTTIVASYSRGTTWNPTEPTTIDENTLDTTTINLPADVLEMLPILASYYVWLDDDIEKATYYWNQYDDMRNTMFNASERGAKATISGVLI